MESMKIYRDRLKSCGFSDADALRITKDFLKTYYRDQELLEFIKDKEKDNFNVDKLQQQSGQCPCGGLCSTCSCKGAKH